MRWAWKSREPLNSARSADAKLEGLVLATGASSSSPARRRCSSPAPPRARPCASGLGRVIFLLPRRSENANGGDLFSGAFRAWPGWATAPSASSAAAAPAAWLYLGQKRTGSRAGAGKAGRPGRSREERGPMDFCCWKGKREGEGEGNGFVVLGQWICPPRRRRRTDVQDVQDPATTCSSLNLLLPVPLPAPAADTPAAERFAPQQVCRPRLRGQGRRPARAGPRRGAMAPGSRLKNKRKAAAAGLLEAGGVGVLDGGGVHWAGLVAAMQGVLQGKKQHNGSSGQQRVVRDLSWGATPSPSSVARPADDPFDGAFEHAAAPSAPPRCAATALGTAPPCWICGYPFADLRVRCCGASQPFPLVPLVP